MTLSYNLIYDTFSSRFSLLLKKVLDAQDVIIIIPAVDVSGPGSGGAGQLRAQSGDHQDRLGGPQSAGAKTFELKSMSKVWSKSLLGS